MDRMPHSNHPGFDAPTCELRITVNAHPYGTSGNGYACGWTGGHCLPSDRCETRRDSHKKETEFKASIIDAVTTTS